MENTDIHTLVTRQRDFFLSGQTQDLDWRHRQLSRLEAAIYVWQPQIEAALMADLGKDATEAWMSEIGMVLQDIRWQKNHLKELGSPKRVPTPLVQFYARSQVIPMPYGNVLVMSPWNYPFLLSMGPLCEAVAAGNTVLLKPGSASVHTSQVMTDMLASVFEDEFIGVVQGGHQENTDLLNEKFDKIFFTGSMHVGQVVMSAAARHLTPVTLELGGKSPVVVDESADIRLSARRIIWGKMLNGGQTCVAPDYVVVHESVHDELVRQLRHEANVQANASCKIISEKALDRLTGLLEKEKVLGHQIYGGVVTDMHMDLAIVDGVDWSDPVMDEEIFGPILPVLTYDSFDGLMERMKRMDHPLAFYLFSRNAGHIRTMKMEMPFGGGCVNDTVVQLASDHMPFGGVGASGMGQYHGRWGFETFTHPKSVLDKGLRVDVPLRYRPFGKHADKWIRRFMR